VRLGFQPERLLTFQIAIKPSQYPDATRRWQFYRRMLESVSGIPGVNSAAISTGIPLGAGSYNRSPFAPTGTSILPPDASLPIDWRAVSPGYFKTMGIPLLAGREFNEQDTTTAPVTIILSRSAAQKFWGSEDPIGKMIHRPTTTVNFTVVGVADDVRNDGLNQEYPALYFSTTNRIGVQTDVAVRTMGKPESVLSAVRARIHDLDPELALSNIRTMDEWVSTNAAQPRVNATLIATFAGVALLIAAIGVYGVLAYSVNQRTREIGLRMALGAQQSGVLRWIVGQGMIVALSGIAIGLAGAFALSRLLASLLFGIQPRDPLTFGSVAVVLCAVAFTACLVPAIRASRVDPLVALRDE
jgi:putative ABC transport system permease protein